MVEEEWIINIIGYLFGIRWITTYNFYTITKDIQITVLGRFFITIYIIWSGNHYFESFFWQLIVLGWIFNCYIFCKKEKNMIFLPNCFEIQYIYILLFYTKLSVSPSVPTSCCRLLICIACPLWAEI